jgi:hypothetical protein
MIIEVVVSTYSKPAENYVFGEQNLLAKAVVSTYSKPAGK